jgi:hypothetical protein
MLKSVVEQATLFVFELVVYLCSAMLAVPWAENHSGSCPVIGSFRAGNSLRVIFASFCVDLHLASFANTDQFHSKTVKKREKYS